MKITIRTEENIDDMEIVITCARLTPQLDKVIASLRLLDRQLPARRGEETFLLDVSQVFYIDTADKKTFIYTEQDMYESNLKLYELETQLEDAGFFRAGKSCILNLKHIRSLKADFDRRIRVTMENGEQLIVSRQYAEQLKKKLGVG